MLKVNLYRQKRAQQTYILSKVARPPAGDPDHSMRGSAVMVKYSAVHKDRVHREDVAPSGREQHSDICAIWDC